MRLEYSALALALTFASATAQEIPRYSMTLLPTLGGTNSSATAINASGDVAGHSYEVGNQTSHAVIWVRKTALDLGTLGGPHSGAHAINNFGHAAGQSQDLSGTSRPFIWQNGQMSELKGLPRGYTAYATGINDMGIVVGSAYLPTEYVSGGGYRGFIATAAGVEFLGTLGGVSSYAYAINASGQIAGSSLLADNRQERAFLHSNGVMLDLGTLGGQHSASRSINAHGHVCGESTLSGDLAIRAFVYRSGVLQNMGSLGGDYAYCLSINENGHFVGSADTATGRQSGYLYDGTAMYNLNDAIGSKFLDGWYVWAAMGINKKGQIAANACKDGFGCRSVRLDPIGQSKRLLR